TTLTSGETVVTAPWPVASGAAADERAAAAIADVMTLVTEIRRFRSDQGLTAGRKVPARFAWQSEGAAESSDPAYLAAAAGRMCRLIDADETFTATASLPVALASGSVTVHLDMSESIDVQAETARAEKGLAAARTELEQADRKLANDAFLTNAPA